MTIMWPKEKTRRERNGPLDFIVEKNDFLIREYPLTDFVEVNLRMSVDFELLLLLSIVHKSQKIYGLLMRFEKGTK